MDSIRVVAGTGTGPTATAAYDDALETAGIHNYNLVTVSSMIPASATVEKVGTAPALGPAGQALTVVQARATAEPGTDQAIAAALGWATGPEYGVFYEAAGINADAIEDELQDGLDDIAQRRDVSLSDRGVAFAESAPHPDQYHVAVVAGIYGESAPIF